MAEQALPVWIARQAQTLLAQRGHAWLLQGPSGLGQYRLALELARAWLCEAQRTPGQLACGHCNSCHAICVHTHADLCILMPEADMLALGMPLGESAQNEIDNKKRKPSREIRVDAMREAVEFAQRTSSRGCGKVMLIYPAERMNTVTANALLKTLEEPSGDTRFVLASEAAHMLLPTIRSRCMGYTMRWPDRDEMQAWLQSEGVGAGQIDGLLRASGGRPDDALAMAHSGVTAEQWAQLPQVLVKGGSGILADQALPQVVSILQKLCHDMLACSQGVEPRFFAAENLPVAAPVEILTRWGRELRRTARTATHTFNAGLMLETLVSQAQSVLAAGERKNARIRGNHEHSKDRTAAQ